MANPFRKLIDALSNGLQKMANGETSGERASRKSQQVQQSVATLLYETARVDHEVRDEDLHVAEDCLRELFAMSTVQARTLLAHAAQLRHRPTSYHPLSKVINEHFSAEEKHRLVEYMWRVAHADREVDMYEDHLVRKIADLLYVPHRDFISAKHRARGKAR
ncbi:MAG: TerB family tellurite resistance protein [Betaproteobacteria bacterium]|jgi:uncharacterized tellurite resistance protein B-like protein|nr:MAG: TerB family tellurite resistance protein [Betaproteobacteria bacterium]